MGLVHGTDATEVRINGPHHGRKNNDEIANDDFINRCSALVIHNRFFAVSLGRYELDLEELRPPLAGYEETASLGVVSNAVHHIDCGASVGGTKETCQIHPGQYLAGLRGDPGKAFGLPDVGEDLPVDVLELVEPIDGFAVRRDDESAEFLQGLRVPKVQGLTAVTHDEASPVVRDTPAFGRVRELLGACEGRFIVNESYSRPPGQLYDSVLENGDAFAEKIWRKQFRIQNLD